MNKVLVIICLAISFINIIQAQSPCPGTPTVIYSGKTYNTVQIGSQCWLKENLNVGTMIQDVDTAKNNGVIEKYCYDNNPANCNTYGGLYLWDEAMQYITTAGTQGICPPGWHIPTLEEFATLATTVNNDGNALKAIGQGIGAGIGTNTSGFSALLAGRRIFFGYFLNLGELSSFWSSREYTSFASHLGLLYDNSNIISAGVRKDFGYSVRCIKDIQTSCPGTPTVNYADQIYNTVQIGSQCWLKENLDVGTMIQGSQNQTNNSVIEKYCYDNNPANCNTYGGLYQWNEAMQYITTAGTRGICPPGWHIPTLEEFATLATTVNNDGNALKAIGQGIGAGIGTNTSGFSALLAGWNHFDQSFGYSGFEELSNATYFWSSTDYLTINASFLWLWYCCNTIILNQGGAQNGFSVRCLKDEGDIVLEMQVNYLSEGPINNFIEVPSNGTGYFYYNITTGGNPVYHQGVFPIKIIKSTSQLLNTEGYFLSPGILRVSIPNGLVDENSTLFMLNDAIQIANTIYVSNTAIPAFYATKIPSEYERTFDIFAGGSAGISGSIGSIGAGVSVSAAKLSVKGEGGVGIKFQVDQDNNIIIDRRFEAGLGVSLEVPSINPGVSGVCDVQAGFHSNIMCKYLSGQSFSFSGLNLSDEKKKMAHSGFMLETMSLAGTGLSPITGLFIRAIVTTLNTLGGVNQTFNDAKISEYWGLGFEGSIGAGLKAGAGPVKMSAFDYTAAGSLMYTSSNFIRSVPNIDNIKKLHKLSFSRSFDFSLLNFGVAFNDGVELGSGNLSLFDVGIGMEVVLATGFNVNNHLENISFSLSGGGESTILFGPQKYRYYQTVVEIPKEYSQVLINTGLGLAGLFSTGINIPLGIQTINQTASAMNNIYTNFSQNPIKVNSNETRGNGYDLNFGIDLDLALGVGLGLSLGVKAKYLDELQFSKKYSEIYANGKNYLIHSSNYSTEMDSLSFKRLLSELFSGTAPLISNALLNLINQITNTIQAGMDFIVGLYDQTGKYIGKVVGNIQHTGQLIISIFSPNSPRIFAKAFEEPVVKNMYYTYDVMHKTFINNKLTLDTVQTMMVVVSENMKLSFIPDGQTTSIDSIDTPIILKMLIDEQLLISNGFSSADKDRVKIYRYDDSLRVWILEGGQRLDDTVMVQVYKMSSYALGIELTDVDDTVPPEIYEHGPDQGSIHNEFPEIYAKIRDNRYGVGIDYTKTFIIINGDTVNYSFNPAIEKIYYQITVEDSLFIGDLAVKIIVTDYNANQSQVEFSFTLNSVNDENLPNGYKLCQNYPNPFNPSTNIEYVIPEEANVKIQIYNSIGQQITTLVNQLQKSGNYKIQFNASELAGGTYFVSLYARSSINGREYKEIRKMIILK